MERFYEGDRKICNISLFCILVSDVFIMSIFYFFLVICFSDFGYCFDKGMMVMVWIKFNKILLSNMISFYIMFSGG